ncbi:ResB family protein [Caldalkalibacillus thermarum TA2.A1]|uniref:Cytochrome c biogenesis protein ResB n=1 Tax=Caldalkalibacillus thermarum (strain TA2.A1) TaxID=986075 RepID=F5L640_CALTT|nr:cytochrome c biogenesis protein ResB [Caldalkalibacillus thermarum]EGL83194.1 ResB family protein [Caldalkalibacillus thermarum TA2.A1]QZT33143.1 cytochrome c biogenesis protein ResB [Caldalkalibacillus thermarum TA2.A1]
MEQIHCDCGHVNPPGTELCEQCGKPFDDQDSILNMRYEGAALRSKRRRKTFIDHIWNFFASVKVGVWLLVITLVASMLGTIYPQQMYIPSTADPYEYYPENYGFGGFLYVTLGFHNLYSSWWYVTLLVLIGISIIVASIDRGLPLYRALKRQRVKRHPQFLKRQRIYSQVTVKQPAQVLEKAKQALASMRYKVREENGAVLGEKNRFSRWGAYVVHLGLIILLVGALLRVLPGFTMDQYVWIRDGEIVPVPGTNNQYYIQSEGFTLKVYEEYQIGEDTEGQQRFIPEDFITEAVLYENKTNASGEKELVKVKEHTIRVNDPLRYEGLSFYQSDYILNQFSAFTFALTHKASGKEVGEMTVDLYDPDPEYDLGNGYKVQLLEYYPDFEMDAHKQPQTKSRIPNNPAFIFRTITPDNPAGEKSMVLIGQTIEMPGEENQYALKINNVEFKNVTGLMVRKERSLPVIYLGLGITMVGLIMCFYWQHRRIWIQQEGSQILLAAHTNKNWFGFKKEVEQLIDQTGLPVDKQTLDKEEAN